MSQKFCNILVAWETIRQLRMLLLRRLFSQWTLLNYKMSSSPDTLQVLLIELDTRIWSTAAESTI